MSNMSETVQGSLFGDESVLSDNKSSLAFRPTRIGQTKVNYSTPRDILTKATGFMSDYDFTLNPLQWLFLWLHILLRCILYQ